MMKKSIAIIFIFIAFIANSQSVYNTYTHQDTWLPSSSATPKSFVKIKITEKGIHRLFYNDLMATGFSFATKENIQLFRRGIEQPVHIETNGDGLFNSSNDYIEFYGDKNDGKLDKELYHPSSYQSHTYHNLYTDTAAYFLCNTPNVNGDRLEGFTAGAGANESYHVEENLLLYTSNFEGGEDKGYQIRSPFFDKGEGWFSPKISSSFTFNFSDISNVQNVSNEPPVLELQIVGSSGVQANHYHSVTVSISSDNTNFTSVNSIDFFGYETKTLTSTLSANDISSSQLYVKIDVSGTASSSIRLAYAKLTYPQSLNVGGVSQKMINVRKKNIGSLSTVSLTNAPANSLSYMVTSDNIGIKRAVNSGTNYSLNIQHIDTNAQKILIQAINDVNVVSPSQLEMKSLKLQDTTNNFIIISHKKFQSEATAYANYRSSVAGGSYDAEVFYMDDLCDVFTYGDFSSLAIRRFADYLISNGDHAKYLLLLGKGVVLNLRKGTEYYRYNQGSSVFTMNRDGQDVKHFNFVPTPGHPGGDVFYTCHITNNEWYPHIPTGRISALLGSEISGYLDKVKKYESMPDDLWKKRVLHLGGGDGAGQIQIFKGYLDGWKSLAEGEYFGGKVESIFKESSSTIQPITVDEQVNEGVRLITFFGHSTAEQSDIDIGFVSDISKNYNNTGGEYPVILVNGCNAGDYYKMEYAFGEDWVLTEQKGAIGFIASSSVGIASTLRNYTNTFYNTAFRDTLFLESTIGNILKETIRRLGFTSTANSNLGHSLNTNLLGDPSIQMFGYDKPDLETNNNAVFIEPVGEDFVTAVSDSFNLGIIVRNFGLYSEADSFFVSVERTYNGITANYTPKIYSAVKYSDTLRFGISSKDIQTFGLNNFKINIDYNHALNLSLIDEHDETNNEANFQYYIPLSGVYPIFPKEFDMVGENNLEYPYPWNFMAQSTDLLVNQVNYVFQLDTTENFNSTLMRQATVLGGSEVEWDNPPILELLTNIQNFSGDADSTVFYWRVRYADQTPGEDTLWGVSSFQYNYQSTGGWAQAHYFQFKKDKQKHLEISEETGRAWELQKIKANLEVITAGPGYPDGNIPKLILNNGNPSYIGSLDYYRKNGFLVTTIDGETFDYVDIPGYGVRAHFHGGAGYQYGFRFNVAAEMDEFCQYIDDVECGDYVVVVTRMRSNFSSLPACVATSLQSIGAVDYTSIVDSQGYVIVGKKCDVATFESILDTTEFFDSTFVLESFLTEGQNFSTIIGPVTSWKKLYRHVKEVNDDNIWGVDINGINLDGTIDTLLYSNVTQAGMDLNIPASQYPYLRLMINKEDQVNRVPPQLKNWIVTYEAEIPEGTIVANSEVDDYSVQEFYEGEKKIYHFRFKNISNYDFQDSLEVHVSFVNDIGVSTPSKFKIMNPSPKQSIDFPYELDTKNLDGYYNLLLTVNPRIELEHYYHNNSITVPFNVIADDIHPILDVTFDGVHIMDYDIVSPKPEIVIRMKDENAYLPKQSLEGITFFIENMDNVQTNIDLTSNEVVVTYPEDGTDDFLIEYVPAIALIDGIYKLYVQVTDEAGNKSGVLPYEVHFEVINKTSMTHFFPYPNPFSTSMRFAYTLTGMKQPDQIKIQIMTISGKIVREITQDELGELKIGKHLTDFVWDGRDDFGAQLANGTYLFRVISNVQNENGVYEAIDFRTAGTRKVVKVDSEGNELFGKSEADQLFKKGWGKIYIMR